MFSRFPTLSEVSELLKAYYILLERLARRLYGVYIIKTKIIIIIMTT